MYVVQEQKQVFDSQWARRRLVGRLGGLLIPPALLAQPVLAADARLSWNAVVDDRPLTYQLEYSVSTGQNPLMSATTATELTLSDLTAGETYRFSVRACVSETSLCGDFSPELVATVPALPPPPPPAPEAGFTGTPLSGPVPLTVVFSDDSAGVFDTLRWDLGDGNSASGTRVVHTYSVAGRYDVALTATGPGGSDTLTRPDYVVVNEPPPDPTDPTDPTDPGDPTPRTALLEAGEVVVDHNWQWVEFQHGWTDPVVVARPLSGNGDDPALVRIDGVSTEGFWVRLQEWDYLDDAHVEESLSWLVAEAGTTQTEDGRLIQAGTVQTNRTGSFQRQDFDASFADVPIVLTAVVTNADAAAVTSRIRRVDSDGFEIGMREQESADQRHGLETLAYIAVEPGVGLVGDLWVEAGSTGDVVTHRTHTLAFESTFDGAPMVLAAMQTTDGGDTATLRWSFRTETAVDLWVDEEQSRDGETNHTTEVVGYLLLEPRADIAPAPEPEPEPAPTPQPGVVYEDAEDGDTLGWHIYTGATGASIANVADTERGGRAIALSGSGWSTGYRLQREDGSVWADADHHVLGFDLNYAEAFHLYVDVETSGGQVYLEYTPSGVGDDWSWEQYVHHGLDQGLVDGRWHRVERDLAADLADAYPRLELLRVNAFLIRGSGLVDNIGLR